MARVGKWFDKFTRAPRRREGRTHLVVGGALSVALIMLAVSIIRSMSRVSPGTLITSITQWMLTLWGDLFNPSLSDATLITGKTTPANPIAPGGEASASCATSRTDSTILRHGGLIVYEGLGGEDVGMSDEDVDGLSPRARRIYDVVRHHPMVLAYPHWTVQIELDGHQAYLTMAAPNAPECEGSFSVYLTNSEITQGITSAIIGYLDILKSEGYIVSSIADA